ncbi:MAG: hypothetical protein HQM09_21415 [Candidatus Riflebacteria bacterium]|nr:hypothetical protein [Candidatus Riflebacteria bacterium]
MQPSFISWFTLDSVALSTLASLEVHLIELDIAKGVDSPDWAALCPADSNEKKGLWVVEWDSSTRKGLSLLNPKDHPGIWSDRKPEFIRQVEQLHEPRNRHLAGLVLLELAAFDAYWPLKREKGDYQGLFIDENAVASFFELKSSQLGFSNSFVKQIRELVRSTHAAIAKRCPLTEPQEIKDWKLTSLALGISSPFWKGLFETGSTFSNDNSIYKGISSIGAGFATTSEFGLSSASPVIAGGGMIPALGIKSELPRHSLLTPESISLSAAKLEVMMKEFILKTPQGKETRKEVLAYQSNAIKFLTAQLPLHKTGGTISISNDIRQTIDILSVSLSRLQEL